MFLVQIIFVTLISYLASFMTRFGVDTVEELRTGYVAHCFLALLDCQLGLLCRFNYGNMHVIDDVLMFVFTLPVVTTSYR